jgi:hypothetical protein
MRSAPRALITTEGSPEVLGEAPADVGAKFFAEFCAGFRANVPTLSLPAHDSLQ